MEIVFVGCGDAFGSGGRGHTCFQVTASGTRFLIDCGASGLAGLKREGIDRNAIDLLLITHLHADHAGGIPFFILDAQFLAKRTRPLTIAGPPGLSAWYPRAMELAFPGSSATRQKFELSLVELAADAPCTVAGVTVRPTLVQHGAPVAPAYGYRITLDGKVLAYTGDTEWTESLVELGRDADLMIAEAYWFEKVVPYHLSWGTLAQHLPRIAPRRLILTHMGDDMLAHCAEVPCETARDGLTITL
ncbi:MAG: MBL fold metallo-hydrolase [Rhodoplanes sp.]|uniref:MBL fold metallo-hydrolase n=1 Tax=Rhodoplanes sp. TaxID=1968906 RepID=UPI001854D3EF|nr:MBL fold metallo-hydrolase [Rhodoplanes sp.]NVO13796.1 MBL fold metallo-hydrolase [Rhodoplanes sp.]